MPRWRPFARTSAATSGAAAPTGEPDPSGIASETRCRNCDTAAPGAYCPACGQETRRALPTLREFMREALGRYVALDGRLWKTVGALLFRPGFLTREYLAGRRRRYIRPARLFLVASVLLFAVLRIEVEFGGVELVTLDDAAVPQAKDSKAGAAARPESAVTLGGGRLDRDDMFHVKLGDAEDLVPGLRDRVAHFNQLSAKEKVTQLTGGMLRYGPYAMFVLLPAFAMLLKIVYLGRRRRHPNRPRLYGEHLVFAAHNHTFLFLAIAAAIAIPVSPLRTLLFLWSVVYMLWSMHAVYGGSWIGIAARAFTIMTTYLVMFGLATAGLLIVAVLLR